MTSKVWEAEDQKHSAVLRNASHTHISVYKTIHTQKKRNIMPQIHTATHTTLQYSVHISTTTHMWAKQEQVKSDPIERGSVSEITVITSVEDCSACITAATYSTQFVVVASSVT